VSTRTLQTHHDEYEALAVAWAVNALEPADQAIFERIGEGASGAPGPQTPRSRLRRSLRTACRTSPRPPGCANAS
jgi:hypothetical protein